MRNTIEALLGAGQVRAIQENLEAYEYPIAFGRHAIFSATVALRISRTAWQLRIDHLCPFAPQDDLLVLAS